MQRLRAIRNPIEKTGCALSDLSEKGVKVISASLQEVLADILARPVGVAKRRAERQLRSGPIAWPVCRAR
jgi:hypothetical protein